MKIIAVASGMLKAKKSEQQFSSLYLNYGLLGLVTNLSKKNYNVKMYQGDYKTIAQTIREIGQENLINSIVLLSVPSFLSLEWALEFAKKIKKFNTKILVGGRWVLDNNLEWVKKKFGENVDGYSLGCPDDFVELLTQPEKWKELETAKKYSHVFDELDYSLLNNFKIYQPSIEVSRGCGSRCNFCVEKNFKHCELKSPESIFYEVSKIVKLYGTDELNIYFESSIFLPSISWAERFAELYNITNSRFKWRCTTRVDAVNVSALSVLSKAGLKVVDFGLESASPKQLLKMGKTTNPETYLKKAENIIRACSLNGVWCKLNIMLYVGETFLTLKETEQWLLKNKPHIKGVSVNPFAIYLNGDITEYCNSLEQISQSKIDFDELYNRGICYPNLSPEISNTRALALCKKLSAKVMCQSDYDDLKSICYSKRIY